MISPQKHIRSLLLAFVGGISLWTLQSVWIHYVYTLKHRQMISNVKDAFHQAYQKEQTYRIPVVDIRAVLQVTPRMILTSMSGSLIFTCCLLVMTLLCMIFLYRYTRVERSKKESDTEKPVEPSVSLPNSAIFIGQYCFDPAKNELTGFGETIQLNKKENSILYALCTKQGNVVERNVLLEENWGNLGIVYSRSLDTYLTKLRKYLKKDPSIQIVTVKGVGYKLVY